jgi:hypothetical protein
VLQIAFLLCRALGVIPDRLSHPGLMPSKNFLAAHNLNVDFYNKFFDSFSGMERVIFNDK